MINKKLKNATKFFDSKDKGSTKKCLKPPTPPPKKAQHCQIPHVVKPLCTKFSDSHTTEFGDIKKKTILRGGFPGAVTPREGISWKK